LSIIAFLICGNECLGLSSFLAWIRPQRTIRGMMTAVKAYYGRTRKTLPQGRKQRFLPAFPVDLPAHFRFAPLLQHSCPYCLLTLIVSAAERIHNRHAARDSPMRRPRA